MSATRLKIHLISPGVNPSQNPALSLTDEEFARARRFHFPKDAAAWIRCRAVLREILARDLGIPPRNIPLIYSEFGKPLLAPPYDFLHFNLSHCPELALLATSHCGPLGIDLEPLTRAADLLGCENSFCHPAEISSLATAKITRSHELLRIWTAKEALLKALGTGLSFPPEKLRIIFKNPEIEALPDLPLQGVQSQRLTSISHPELKNFSSFLSFESLDSNYQIDFIEMI